MKLPKTIAAATAGEIARQRSGKAFKVAVKGWSSPLPSGILPMTQKLSIAVCTRPVTLSSGNGDTDWITHCYAKLVDENGKAVDSVAFGLDGPQTEGKLTGECRTLKDNVDRDEWMKFKENITSNHRTYDVCSNNCCKTVYESALETTDYDTSALYLIYQAKLGVGEKYGCR